MLLELILAELADWLIDLSSEVCLWMFKVC